jgi:hypothetical protein
MRHARLLAALAAALVASTAAYLRTHARPTRAAVPAAASTAAPAASPAATPAIAPPPPGPRRRRGGMDLTFLVTADTHAGFWEKIPVPGHPAGLPVEKVHEIAIQAMNEIPGTPFPAALGGAVGKPRGLLIAGDLTEMGAPWEWASFEKMFGLTGAEGWLRHPVYENVGNHDAGADGLVRREVVKRHGAARYAWDWDDVHLVSFGEAPDDGEIDWLREDLAALGPEVGVVLFFHYPMEGPYSRGNWFAEGDHHERLHRALAGHPVLGIFNGHFHASGRYRWRGHDGYLQGSVKHSWHSFSVVHVSDTRFTVASYNYDRRAFWWWHDKPIFGAAGGERSYFAKDASLEQPR